MNLLMNKCKTEVLPGEPCPRNRRGLSRQGGLALTPIARPNRLRKLVGGRLTLPEVFPVLALIFIVGYLICCNLGEPTLSSAATSVVEVSSTFSSGLHMMAAFAAVVSFIYLTVALLWPERFS